MTPLDIALSFVISYVAGIIPTDWLRNYNSLKEKLDYVLNVLLINGQTIQIPKNL
ncbi:hypothetical protein IX324_002896 [Bacteroides pyogenes]|nr:hypothetical protein [Bacteroides pyogenes]